MTRLPLSSSPGGDQCPSRGSTNPAPGGTSSPMEQASTWSRAEDEAWAEPWSSKKMETASRVSCVRASGHPSSDQVGIERRAGVRLDGVAQAPLEHVPVVAVHQRSAPRSSNRRAMMFRWISAVPP